MRNLALIVLAACAGSPPPAPQNPGSRGMRASQHLEAARMHDEAAREQAAWPTARSPWSTPPEEGGPLWHFTWDTYVDHERLAAIHRSEAAAIHAEYERACGDRPAAEVMVSPLRRYELGGRDTSDGVVLYLSPAAGPRAKLLAAVRCHRAWMMLAPTANMDDCPLDLAGITIDATGSASGITVTITVHDRRLLPELQRRAARELELSRSHPTR